MSDLVDTSALRHAIEQVAHAVATLGTHAGDVSAVRRLRNDVERLRIDADDCKSLRSVAAARQLEIIPDTPYDEAMWQDVDDEGLGGFRHQSRPQTRR